MNFAFRTPNTNRWPGPPTEWVCVSDFMRIMQRLEMTGCRGKWNIFIYQRITMFMGIFYWISRVCAVCTEANLNLKKPFRWRSYFETIESTQSVRQRPFHSFSMQHINWFNGRQSLEKPAAIFRIHQNPMFDHSREKRERNIYSRPNGIHIHSPHNIESNNEPNQPQNHKFCSLWISFALIAYHPPLSQMKHSNLRLK